jgi:hypothetical protein
MAVHAIPFDLGYVFREESLRLEKIVQISSAKDESTQREVAQYKANNLAHVHSGYHFLKPAARTRPNDR